MSVFVVGSSEPIGALAAALSQSGVAAEAYRLDSASTGAQALADSLVELERAVGDSRPEAIVALGGNDATTAAALVAGKAGIPLFSSVEPSVETGDEARASRVLSELSFEFPRDGPGIARAAERIAAALAGPGGAP